MDLHFEVKFHVEYPARLQVEQTRWLFFLQAWIQTASGQLDTTPQTGCLLTSYFLQATSGPFRSEADDALNLSKLNPLPGFVRENAAVVFELRQLLKDQTADEATNRFLDHVRRLERYGVEFHPVRDVQGKPIELGVSGRSLTVYRAGLLNRAKMNTFPWCRIVRLFYKRKRFFIQLQKCHDRPTDTLVVGFKAPSSRAAKRLWRSSTEQHSFFRMYRLDQQVMPSAGHRKSPPATKPGLLGRLFSMGLSSSCYDTGEKGSSSTYRRYDLHKVSAVAPGHQQMLPVSSPSPRPAWSSSLEPLGSSLDDIKSGCGIHGQQHSQHTGPGTYSWSSVSPCDLAAAYHGPGISLGYADETASSVTESACDTPQSSDSPPCYPPPMVPVDRQDVYQVRLRPDPEGRFGLNLRYDSSSAGGLLNAARLSRLLPDSSADLCYPRLRIGDQLLDVDGQPVQCLKHDELIGIFRTAAGHQAPLTLSLRRSSTGGILPDTAEPVAVEYVGGCVDDESSTAPTAVESVAQLSEELRTGRILARFELLPKSRLELTCSAARLDANMGKNRYGDILPYDCNRVVLSVKNAEETDYINASYVTLPSPRGRPLLRYIACQGPLAHTVEDFWSAIWQEGIRTVAMITPEEERGRIKCHRYWPEADEMVTAGSVSVSCQLVHHCGHYIHRQFILSRIDGMDESSRAVDHLQYLDWPDHGAPMTPTWQFIDYVRSIRQLNGDSGAILVHCSAGIGRTGAFILLDAALHWLDAGMAVDPIQLVRLMRDQRAMMLQTSVSE